MKCVGFNEAAFCGSFFSFFFSWYLFLLVLLCMMHVVSGRKGVLLS
jgi:hypothetical protein